MSDRLVEGYRMKFKILIYLLVFGVAALVTASPRFELKTNRYVAFYNLQAKGFLNGQADLDLPPDWGHDVIKWEGKKYFALPPLNGILLMPAVAIFGVEFPERYFTLFLFAAYLALISWFVTYHVKTASKLEYALWVSFISLGTGIITCTATATAWFSAVLCSSLLVSCAAMVAWRARTFTHHVLAIAILCVAAMGRYQLILMAPVFLLNASLQTSRYKFKDILALSSPVLLFLLFIAGWNWVRWHEFFSLHYRDHGFGAFFGDTISHYGFTSWRYIFLHLYHGLFGIPRAALEFPFFEPDKSGNGLFAISPLFLFMIFRKHQYEIADWFSVLCIALPTAVLFTHFSTGWSQFGYRYALDVFPFLIFLLSRSNFKISSPLGITLVSVSIWFNVVGTLLFVR
jgi:hypothetical protein